MISKSITHFERFAMILKALDSAVEFIWNMGWERADETFTSSFIDKCEMAVRDPPDAMFVIDEVIIKRAINLEHYFMKHKMLLSSYDINPCMPINDTIRAMISEHSKTTEVCGVFTNYTTEEIIIMRRILLHDKPKFSPDCLATATTPSKIILNVMTSLQVHGLGSLNYQKRLQFDEFEPIFTKITYRDLLVSNNHRQHIKDLGLNIAEFSYTLYKSENACSSVDKIKDENNNRS